MKNTILLAFILLFMVACDKDDHSTFEYHAHIHSPVAGTEFNQDDSLHIEVEFESHTNNTVHHINVKIVNSDNNQEVYNQPTDAHVHETSGKYEFHDKIRLDAASGFVKGGNYILRAKVWGHETGEEEEISEVGFKIKP